MSSSTTYRFGDQHIDPHHSLSLPFEESTGAAVTYIWDGFCDADLHRDEHLQKLSSAACPFFYCKILRSGVADTHFRSTTSEYPLGRTIPRSMRV